MNRHRFCPGLDVDRVAGNALDGADYRDRRLGGRLCGEPEEKDEKQSGAWASLITFGSNAILPPLRRIRSSALMLPESLAEMMRCG
jgi:hypothetical protein